MGSGSELQNKGRIRIRVQNKGRIWIRVTCPYTANLIRIQTDPNPLHWISFKKTSNLLIGYRYILNEYIVKC